MVRAQGFALTLGWKSRNSPVNQWSLWPIPFLPNEVSMSNFGGQLEFSCMHTHTHIYIYIYILRNIARYPGVQASHVGGAS